MPKHILGPHRDHKTRPGESTVGRTIVYVTCPYCGIETECYLWSLSGSGKRCQCGAKHMGQGYTYAPPNIASTGIVAGAPVSPADMSAEHVTVKAAGYTSAATIR